MRVAIGSDHAGFDLKEAVKGFLGAEHHEPVRLDAIELLGGVDTQTQLRSQPF